MAQRKPLRDRPEWSAMTRSRTTCDGTPAASREALEALAAQLSPPTAHDIRRALQTLSRAGAPVDLLEALEAWSDGQMPQAA